MMKKVLFLFFGVASAIFAGITLDPVFSSNMVLQREKPIVFFGKGDAGKKIIATWDKNTVSTTVAQDGTWSIQFPARGAEHKPQTIRFTDGASNVILENVLVGEVWFCSGQSNMAMPVRGNNPHRGWAATNFDQECANANYPEMRVAIQRHAWLPCERRPASIHPNGKWQPVTPTVAAGGYFSACGYFFGRTLLQDLKVPIGLIFSSVGGTRIEAWMDPETIQKENFQPERSQVQKFKMTPAQLKTFEASEEKRYSEQSLSWNKAFLAVPAVTAAKAKSANWFDVKLDETEWTKQPSKGGEVTVRWIRMKFRLPKIKQGTPQTFLLADPGAQCDVWLNGERIGGVKMGTGLVAKREVRVNSIPAAKFVQNGENLLVIRTVIPSSQFSRCMRNISNALLAGKGGRFFLRQSVLYKDEIAGTCAEWKIPRFPGIIYERHRTSYFPGSLYNGMVNGWIRLPIRGVIWYQGCANTHHGSLYYLSLRALIAGWREKWKNPEMPFMVVQLAGYDPARTKTWATAEPAWRHNYAVLRDSQFAAAASLKNVGCATAVDIGEVDNIHPGNKQELGRRLALEAERIVYGKKIVSRGPVMKSAVREGKTFRVTFDNADGLKTSDGKAPNGFDIAGPDGAFHWADSVKIEGNSVVVSCSRVSDPREVRYAYVGFRGDLNLQNAAGLPAFPFRSKNYDYSKARADYDRQHQKTKK